MIQQVLTYCQGYIVCTLPPFVKKGEGVGVNFNDLARRKGGEGGEEESENALFLFNFLMVYHLHI